MGIALPRLTPVVKWIMIANVAIFLMIGLAMRITPGLGIVLIDNLALSTAGNGLFKIWTYLTYAFMHDLRDIFHLLFNMLVLYFFGPQLEQRWGARRFIIFYLLAALGGALLFVAFNMLTGSPERLIGASAAVLGLIVAWGMIYPNLPIYFFGILPLQGKHLIAITVAVEVLVAVSQSATSSSAHFGGMAMGALIISGYWRPTKLKNLFRQQKSKHSRSKLHVVIPPKDDGAPPGGWVQ